MLCGLSHRENISRSSGCFFWRGSIRWRDCRRRREAPLVRLQSRQPPRRDAGRLAPERHGHPRRVAHQLPHGRGRGHHRAPELTPVTALARIFHPSIQQLPRIAPVDPPARPANLQAKQPERVRSTVASFLQNTVTGYAFPYFPQNRVAGYAFPYFRRNRGKRIQPPYSRPYSFAAQSTPGTAPPCPNVKRNIRKLLRRELASFFLSSAVRLRCVLL